MDDVESEKLLRAGYDHFLGKRFGEAEGVYREVLRARPTDPDGLQLLGLVMGETGRYGEAVGLLRRVIGMHPKVPRLHWTVGDYLVKAGDWKGAAEAFQGALAIKPDDAETLSKLGGALKQLGHAEEAAGVLRKALEIQPGMYQAMINLGAVYTEMGRFAEAEEILREAVAKYPEAHEGWVNLGSVMKSVAKVDEAIEVLEKAQRMKPDSPEGLNNLGAAYLLRGRLDEAAGAFEKAIGLGGSTVGPAIHNLAITRKDQGMVEEAVRWHEKAIAADPMNALYESNRLFTLHLDWRLSGERLLEEHKKYNRFLPSGPRVVGLNELLPEKKLKVGLVSPDLRKHAVAFFLLPLLENYDRNEWEVICYQSGPVADEVTEKMKGLVAGWRNIVAMTPDQAAEQIRADEIDVLVDLAGHTANSRLLVFARKPAPVQMTWLGYPGTTGLSTMDWRVSDGFADPEGAERFCSEKILRMQGSAWCFHPLSGSPAVKELPAKRNGYVTFGTFNNFPKISPQTLEMWAEILRGVAGSKLLLKNNSMRSGHAVGKVKGFMAERGIAQERVEVERWREEFDEHLEMYNRVDVGLDTFPYHGTTTTCEALWMGVPVVSLAGGTHCSRVGVSLLNAVGLGEMVAGDAKEYVGKAVGLAGDLAGLEKLRKGLRERMHGSGLMDGKGFAKRMQGGVRGAWRGYCRGK